MFMLVLGGYVVWKGIFVTGRSADQRVADLTRSHQDALKSAKDEAAYREERRIEERANRLLLEEALRSQVHVMRDMTELLKDIERNFRVPG